MVKLDLELGQVVIGIEYIEEPKDVNENDFLLCIRLNWTGENN